jgi:hypothetical protein
MYKNMRHWRHILEKNAVVFMAKPLQNPTHATNLHQSELRSM